MKDPSFKNVFLSMKIIIELYRSYYTVYRLINFLFIFQTNVDDILLYNYELKLSNSKWHR